MVQISRSNQSEMVGKLELRAPRPQFAQMRLVADREAEPVLPLDPVALKEFCAEEIYSSEETLDNNSFSGKELLSAIKLLSLNADSGFTFRELEVNLPQTYSFASHKLVEALEKLIEAGVLSRQASLRFGAIRYLLTSAYENQQAEIFSVPAASSLTPELQAFEKRTVKAVLDELDPDNGLNVYPLLTVENYLKLREGGQRIPKLLEDGSLLADPQPVYGVHIQLFERIEEEAVRLGLVRNH